MAHKRGADPQAHAFRAAQAPARKAKENAGVTRQARQKVAAAHVGKQAEAGFRHGKYRAVSDDALAAVDRYADAAAHDDTVHECDIRLGKTPGESVEAIFRAPECERIRPSGFSLFIEL